MSKASRRTNRADRDRTTPVVAVDAGSGFPWFGLSIAAVAVVGMVVVLVLAQQRESVVGIAPEALVDHWHDAFAVNICGEWLPPTTDTAHGDGIHSHADGLIHIHPSNTAAAGPNATLGEFLDTAGAVLTDNSYSPGRGEVPTVLDEAQGCNGEPAELVLAVWPGTAAGSEPVIVRDELADFRFVEDGQILTLALLPVGAPVPQSPNASQVNNPGDLG